MLRRSARKKAEEVSAPTAVQAVKRAPNKRPKKAAAAEAKPDPKPQRRRGKLRFIAEMPLDILFEIFGQLYPLDLLNISRSSKALRNIILRKSAAWIWKGAFQNITIGRPPPCPDDLNEAQYTNLLWGKHCFFCGITATVVFWQCRVRSCESCPFTSKFTRFTLSADMTGTAADLCTNWYYHPYGYMCLTSDLDSAQKRLDELAESDTPEQEFILLCRKNNLAKEKHAHLCQSWVYSQNSYRKMEQKSARERWKKAILDRLKELGWNEELSNRNTIVNLLTMPAFKKQRKELTERIWTNIEPDLVAYLTEAKHQRLQDERISVLKSRIRVLTGVSEKDLSAMPISEPRPTISDVCAMPEYRAILESPSDTTIIADDFVELLTHLSEQTDRWHTSNVEILLRLLPSFKSSSKQKATKKPDTSSLELCTTFFRCHSCREPISYPRILSHTCLFKRREETEEEEVDLLPRASPSDSWVHGHRGIAFDTEAANITTMLIKLGGRDPKTLTSAMMDELDLRFECLRCPHPRQGRLVMTWKIALLHELEEHYGDTLKPNSWKTLGAEEVITAKQLEAKARKQPIDDLQCLKCNHPRTYTRRQMEQHFLTQHSTEFIEDNVMQYPDVTMRMPPAAVRIRNNDA